jgi:hypothetical protein
MVATSLPARMRTSLLGYWQQARPWQRLGYLVGGALIVQVLPALAWLLSFADLPEPRRVGLVRIAALGYVALVVVSLLQTASGVAPFDVGVVAAALYLLGVVLLGMALVTAVLALRGPAHA